MLSTIMKFFLLIMFLTNISIFSKGENVWNDTLKKEESKILLNVIESKSTPTKEEVLAINEFTKYGFKNLFTQFHYSPALPYSNQINPNAEFFMRDYLHVHEKQLIKLKSFAIPYFDLIDNIFAQYGIPAELKYLAVIESSLKTNATSWVGAAGPWQFMPETANRYGLIVKNGNDQRRDYYKSTHAAARMLLSLYQELDDWLLVIAAYNGGLGRVNNAIKKTGSRDFWQLQYHLPLESRNHVKKFIATHYVMETNSTSVFYEHKKNNENAINKPDTSYTSSIIISGKYIAAVIAKNIAMEESLFEKYNPKFDKNISTQDSVTLFLPKEKMEMFLSKKYEILKECIQIMIGNHP